MFFKKNCFGTNKFVKVTKQSLYKANSFACSLANRDKPLAATFQRKCSGGINFVIVTKMITKIIVPTMLPTFGAGFKRKTAFFCARFGEMKKKI